MASLEPVSCSVAEAAQALGVSRPTVYRLIARSDFPAFKVGGRTLVSIAGLRSWVASQTEVQGDVC